MVLRNLAVKLDKINPYFQTLDVDFLYHFGLDTSMDLKGIFGKINYVVLTRDHDGAAVIAHLFGKKWYQIQEGSFNFTPIFKTERFHLFKIGPVLIVSHGVGMPSMMICLNELTKLLIYTGNTDAHFLKIGPSGGLGEEPGTIIISRHAVNSKLEALQHTIECGEEYTYSTALDKDFVDDVLEFGKYFDSKRKITSGKSIGAWDFFEEQARLDGFLPLPYTVEDRDSYFQRAQKAGVKCIDMESLEFAAFCNNLGIKGCIINSVIINRLKSDMVKIAHTKYQIYAYKFLINYIAFKLKPELIKGESNASK